MAAFSYQALNEKGKKVKGVMEGDSARQVRQSLRDSGLKPLEVNQTNSNSDDSDKQGFSLSFSRGNRAKLKAAELALFTRQLATLVQSGLPLDEALQAVADQSPKQSTKSLVLDLRSKIVEGHSLAYALAEYPKVFSNMYRAMVNAGEHAGFLGPVMDRLADYTESSEYTQQKIKMAMIYPIVLVVVAMSVIVALMVLVVPKLIKIFNSSGAELPALTKAMIAISDFLVNYGLFLGLGIAAVIIGIQMLLRAPERRRKYHAFLLKAPLMANMFRTIDTSRFSSTLSILIASGVPLLEAIKIAGAVLTNMILQESCKDVGVAVQEGSSFHKALDKTGQFPPMLVHMVASGEASGELETMLERVAKNQERELEMTVGTMMGLMEPLLIVFMGGFVLLIVLAILMPIFQLNTLV